MRVIVELKVAPFRKRSRGEPQDKNRKPGQPFFAVFNLLVSHESQIRTRPHKLVHDPARVRLPAYHPDTSEVRRDWALNFIQRLPLEIPMARGT